MYVPLAEGEMWIGLQRTQIHHSKHIAPPSSLPGGRFLEIARLREELKRGFLLTAD